MRNIEILTHCPGILSGLDAGETVLRACVDEFDKTLFIYTSNCRLLGFKLDFDISLLAKHGLEILKYLCQHF